MDNTVFLRHTVRKGADGKPLEISTSRAAWHKMAKQQAGNYPEQGKWLEIMKTVEMPPEAKEKAPAKPATKPRRTRKKSTQ